MGSVRPAMLAMLLVANASGCAWFRVLARPDPEPAPPSAPWAVVCVWVEHRPPGREASLGPLDHDHLWARDPNGRRVAVRGGLEDGFLRVDELYAWTPERGEEPLGVPPSREALQLFCDDTLASALPGRNVSLDRIAAAREGEDVEVPMAFAAELPAAPESTVKRIVVFGDSLSDPGNLKRRLKVFPLAPYYLGRFSDGPNWTQYLAERTALPVYNHAVGGAVSVPHDDIPAAGIISAVQQGAQFLLTGSLDQYVGDYLQRDLLDGQLQRTSDTVFFIWSGGNDYLSKEPISGDIGVLLDEPNDPAGYVRVVEQATTSIADQVRRLHAAGGRRFVVMTLPDLGTIPGVLHNESYRPEGKVSDVARRAQLSRRMAKLTDYHNDELEKRIDTVRRELPGASVSILDVEKAIEHIRAGRLPSGDETSPRVRRFAYGFDLKSLRSTELRDRRGVIAIQDRCYRGGYLGTSDPQDVCTEEAKAFFWDMVHPTSFTHCWLAFFVERQLAQDGLIDRAPDAAAHRAYCERRQEPITPANARRDPAEVSAP